MKYLHLGWQDSGTHGLGLVGTGGPGTHQTQTLASVAAPEVDCVGGATLGYLGVRQTERMGGGGGGGKRRVICTSHVNDRPRPADVVSTVTEVSRVAPAEFNISSSVMTEGEREPHSPETESQESSIHHQSL